jgi:hypothetical protein
MVTLGGVACSGAPLGGGTGGKPGASGAGCTPSGSCISGAAGAVGTGGAGATCDQLAAAYTAAVKAATACTPGAQNQCQALVATFPSACPDSACGKLLYVNDNTQVESARWSWLDACDPGDRSLCVSAGCDPPTLTAICVPDGRGTTTGTCMPAPASDGGIAPSPDAGESCDQLLADYQAAVNAARTCKSGAPNQCQVLLNSLPTGCNNGCGATVVANDATAVNAAWNKWANQCALSLGCTLNICQPPPGPLGTCVTLDGGTDTGLCVAGTPQTP